MYCWWVCRRGKCINLIAVKIHLNNCFPERMDGSSITGLSISFEVHPQWRWFVYVSSKYVYGTLTPRAAKTTITSEYIHTIPEFYAN